MRTYIYSASLDLLSSITHNVTNKQGVKQIDFLIGVSSTFSEIKPNIDDLLAFKVHTGVRWYERLPDYVITLSDEWC